MTATAAAALTGPRCRVVGVVGFCGVIGVGHGVISSVTDSVGVVVDARVGGFVGFVVDARVGVFVGFGVMGALAV